MISLAEEGLPSSPYIARFLSEDDEPALAAMLQEAFGGWPRFELGVEPLDHLRWKMGSQPGSQRFQVVAEADGMIVGSQLHMSERVKLGDRELSGRQSSDIAVHPQYRERGVFAAMRQVREDVIDKQFDLHVGGYARNPAVLRLRARKPQESVPFANETVVLAQPPAFGRELLTWSKALRFARLLPASILAALRRAREGEREWSIVRVQRFDERFDDLWDDASTQFQYAIVRRKEFLNWRYADLRAGLFTTWAAEQDGRILGYAVQRVSYHRGIVADLLARQGRIDVVRSLLRHVCAEMRAAGLSRIEAWLPRRHPYRDALRDYGFLRVRRLIPFDLRALHVPPEWLDVIRDPLAPVHITAGDTDLV